VIELVEITSRGDYRGLDELDHRMGLDHRGATAGGAI
jgi:hypothetical protein